MSSSARHRLTPPRKRRVATAVVVTVAVAVVATLTGGVVVYRHLEGNITALDTTRALGTDRPEPVAPGKPMNILLLGSDTREGQGNNIGGETPGLSDTTILLHLSADRDFAYGVSLPRDAMVERPECLSKDGETTVAGGLSMFNTAYAVGGPGCTQRTVEQLTGIRIDHFVVVDFNGFKEMVDALGGVEVCVPTEVNDTVGNIHLPAGTYEVTGSQALDYVRLRHELSENGDIGRMKRQQAFLASMANKAISLGTLSNPVRLYNFLDAATKSLTTDPGLADLQKLAGIARELKGIGLENIQFLTVPFEWYEPDPNRVVWAPEADKLWRKIRHDEPLGPDVTGEVITAADKPSGETPSAPGTGDPSKRPTSAASPARSPSPSTEAAVRAANGLCV